MSRVLHLLAPAPFGGLESVVQALATEQAKRGHDVHVAAILDAGTNDHPLLAALRTSGVHTHALSVPARAYRGERARIRQLCATLRPDIVHTHGYRTDVLHSPIARRLGIATVSTSHGFTGGDGKNRFYELLQRRAFRRCDAVVAVSRRMADELAASGVAARRIHCIPNAWTGGVPFLGRAEARRVLGIPNAQRAIGFVGRLGFEKGADVFVEALAHLDDRVRAVVIGDGILRERLEARAAALGRAQSVTWKGMLANAGTLMKAFDLIVLSSRTEGTPIVLLEAIAAGVPVVATRVGGVPDVVADDEALLVPPEDALALANGIRQALQESDASGERAARALQRLHASFGAEAWIERYEAVYAACGATGNAVESAAALKA